MTQSFQTASISTGTSLWKSPRDKVIVEFMAIVVAYQDNPEVHKFGTSAAILRDVTLKPQTTSSPILLLYNEQIPVTPLVATLLMNVIVSRLPLGELQLQSSSNAHEDVWKVVNRLYNSHSILSANNPLNTPAGLSGTTECGASRGSITKSAQSRPSSPLPKSFYSRLASPPRGQTVNSDSLLTTRIGSARTRSTGTPIAPLPKTCLGTRWW